MGFLAWIILGLIVGAIVKAVMPGRVGGRKRRMRPGVGANF